MRSRLTVDLQEGFKDDIVIVKLAGKEIFRKEKVSSSLLAGPADSIIASVEGPSELEVIVPSKGLRDSTKLEPRGDTYLGISMSEPDVSTRKIRFIISGEPFGYL